MGKNAKKFIIGSVIALGVFVSINLVMIYSFVSLLRVV